MLYTLASGLGLIERYPTEDVRAAWEEHGEWILETWIDHFPGSRPFGWYLAVGVPRFGERRLLEDRMRLPCWRENSSHHGILNIYSIAPAQEPEVEYLRRHGQLSEEEDAALARGEGIQCVSGYPAGAFDVLFERGFGEGSVGGDMAEINQETILCRRDKQRV
jgi:hypothetical protein